MEIHKCPHLLSEWVEDPQDHLGADSTMASFTAEETEAQRGKGLKKSPKSKERVEA